jgi:hypothetical protein
VLRRDVAFAPGDVLVELGRSPDPLRLLAGAVRVLKVLAEARDAACFQTLGRGETQSDVGL